MNVNKGQVGFVVCFVATLFGGAILGATLVAVYATVLTVNHFRKS